MVSIDWVGGVTFRTALIGTAQIVVEALQVMVHQHLDVTVIWINWNEYVNEVMVTTDPLISLKLFKKPCH